MGGLSSVGVGSIQANFCVWSEAEGEVHFLHEDMQLY